MNAWLWGAVLFALVLIALTPSTQRGWDGFWKDFNRINNHGEDDIDVVTE